MNNKRLPLVNRKLPIKKTNRSPYFTALQYINNIETQTSPKRTFHRQEFQFFQKIPSSGLKIICQFVKVDQNVNKPLARALRCIIIKSFFLAIDWTYLYDLSHTFLKRL